jgi:hypothetical protein
MSAAAEPAKDIFKKAGLIGQWTTGSCNDQPSPQNQHELVSATKGDSLRVEIDLGPKYGKNIYIVTEARDFGNGKIWAKVILQNVSTVQEHIYLVERSRFRTLSNMSSDKSFLIKDGINSNSEPTPWRVRCR